MSDVKEEIEQAYSTLTYLDEDLNELKVAIANVLESVDAEIDSESLQVLNSHFDNVKDKSGEALASVESALDML